MYLPKFFVGDVRVNLRRRDISVAEERLDGAQVGAVHKEVGGELVTELMRSDMIGDTGFASVEVHKPLDRARDYSAEHFRIFAFADADEHSLIGIGTLVEIIFDGFLGAVR